MGNTICDDENDENTEIVVKNYRKIQERKRRRSRKCKRRRKSNNSAASSSPVRGKVDVCTFENILCVKHAKDNDLEQADSSCSFPDCDECAPPGNKKPRLGERGTSTEVRDDCSTAGTDDTTGARNDSCANNTSRSTNSAEKSGRRKRSESKTILSRIIAFLGLSRKNSKQNCTAATRNPSPSPSSRKCSKCGSARRSSAIQRVSTQMPTSSPPPAETQCPPPPPPPITSSGVAQRKSDLVFLPFDKVKPSSPPPPSPAPCDPNCQCPFCPYGQVGQGRSCNLDNILVTPECGEQIIQSIRATVFSELESRLEGVGDLIVEEERQYWASYITNDICPRCCAGLTCELHGTAGCVACLSHSKTQATSPCGTK